MRCQATEASEPHADISASATVAPRHPGTLARQKAAETALVGVAVLVFFFFFEFCI
jgi:hypothetical protein